MLLLLRWMMVVASDNRIIIFINQIVWGSVA